MGQITTINYTHLYLNPFLDMLNCTVLRWDNYRSTNYLLMKCNLRDKIGNFHVTLQC